jgi:hypothetical protein
MSFRGHLPPIRVLREPLTSSHGSALDPSWSAAERMTAFEQAFRGSERQRLGVTGPKATWFSSDLIRLIAWPVWGIAGVHGDIRSWGNRVSLRGGGRCGGGCLRRYLR